MNPTSVTCCRASTRKDVPPSIWMPYSAERADVAARG